MTLQISIKHENDAIGAKALRTLQNLVSSAEEDVLMQSRVLLQQVVEKISVDLKKYTLMFTKNPSGDACVSIFSFCDGISHILKQLIYIYVYIYIYLSIYIYIYISIYLSIYIYNYKYIYLYLFIYLAIFYVL